MQHIELKNKTIFVTGSAGFIGSNLILELLKTQSPVNIIGLDNMNNYYDVSIKEWRLKEIEKCLAQHNDSTYKFYRGDLADKALIDQIFVRTQASYCCKTWQHRQVFVTLSQIRTLTFSPI